MNEKIYLVKVERICECNDMRVNETYPCISLSVARELKNKIIEELTDENGWLEDAYSDENIYTIKSSEDSFSCVDNYAFDNWYINIEAADLIALNNFPLPSIQEITKD